MIPSGYEPEYLRVRRVVLVVLALSISALFLWMIHEFLTSLLFAGILSALFYPLYRRLVTRFGGRRRLASVTTIGIVFLVVVIPLIGLLTLVARQAIELGYEARPWAEEQLRRAPELLERVGPYRGQLLQKAGEIAGQAGAYAALAITSAARQTITFFLLLFVMLYAMFFFLTGGRALLRRILKYLPLPAEDENRILEEFVSVTRATIKGTLLVGAVHGALQAVSFWAVGIHGVALWGTLMAVLSVMPGIGSALIWLPAVGYLALSERWDAAIGVALWCSAVVGIVDNVLRPRLIGKDTKMSDLMILLSTLGGIVLFGVTGFVTGPIIAALFVTIWDLYGAAFKDVLPEPDLPVSVIPPPPSLKPPGATGV